jgi:hypothetical protein
MVHPRMSVVCSGPIRVCACATCNRVSHSSASHPTLPMVPSTNQCTYIQPPEQLRHTPKQRGQTVIQEHPTMLSQQQQHRMRETRQACMAGLMAVSGAVKPHRRLWAAMEVAKRRKQTRWGPVSFAWWGLHGEGRGRLQGAGSCFAWQGPGGGMLGFCAQQPWHHHVIGGQSEEPLAALTTHSSRGCVPAALSCYSQPPGVYLRPQPLHSPHMKLDSC